MKHWYVRSGGVVQEYKPDAEGRLRYVRDVPRDETKGKLPLVRQCIDLFGLDPDAAYPEIDRPQIDLTHRPRIDRRPTRIDPNAPVKSITDYEG